MRILVAGSQNHSPYVEQVGRLGNVELLGYVGKCQLAPLMRDSVALLFLNRYETFGIAAAEAMAVGTPVIGTHFTAVPEVVGNAGVLMDVAKPEEIASQIVQFAGSESLRSQYIASGRIRAENLRWAACVARLEQALAGSTSTT
jgi:glycosyltransferase involved in cell wall biosynthesis